MNKYDQTNAITKVFKDAYGNIKA